MTRTALIVFATTWTVGCAQPADDGEETGTTPPPEIRELTVDASDPVTLVHVDLAAGEVLTDLGDGLTWDLAFRGTDVRVNSGPSGPGSAGVGLMATPDGIYDGAGAVDEAAVQALTPESTLDLLLADHAIPSPQPDEVVSVFDDDFYNYDAGTGELTEDDTVGWLVRAADGKSYARVRITDIDFLTRSGKGVETFTIAVEPEDKAGFGKAQSFTSSVPSEGSVCYDIETDAIVGCETADWDLSFGYFGRTTFVYTNGGDIGPGQGGAYGPVDWTALQAYTAAASDPSGTDLLPLYEADRIVGPYDEAPWHVEIGDGIWPNYRVYYVDPNDDGDAYVLQVLGAKDPGSDGPWRLRYYAL